jgi:hypothetical protein
LDELALKICDDRLLGPDPAALVGREAEGFELVDRLVEPVLVDGEGAS